MSIEPVLDDVGICGKFFRIQAGNGIVTAANSSPIYSAASLSADEVASYHYCRQLARQTARNFYYAFWSLPSPQFRAMCALYAFLRVSDDLGDDSTQTLDMRRTLLQSWRTEFQQALNGEPTSHPLFPGLRHTIRTFQLPVAELQVVLDGIESDLTPTQPQTFADLEHYCYQVAGAVGLCCIQIWGYSGATAREDAIACGLAFQMTNILRDLGEDARAGRVYLPHEELERFGYPVAGFGTGERNPAFQQLMAFQVARTRQYYAQAEQLAESLSPVGRPILRTMIRLYRGILDEIERRDFDIYTSRVELNRWYKLRLAVAGVCEQQWLTWCWNRKV